MRLAFVAFASASRNMDAAAEAARCVGNRGSRKEQARCDRKKEAPEAETAL